MELSKQEFNNKLNEAVNQGYINSGQANQARLKFKRSGDTEILNTIEIQKEAKTKAQNLMRIKWYDLSDTEALQTIVKQNNAMISQQKEIKGWVTFLGLVTLVGLIGAVILALQ